MPRPDPSETLPTDADTSPPRRKEGTLSSPPSGGLPLITEAPQLADRAAAQDAEIPGGSEAVLVVSDFHLGAGPQEIEHDAFTEDVPFVELLDHYGSAEEFKQLHFFLNGDFFDSLEVRLHGRLPLRVYEPAAVEKIQRVLAGHAAVFGALARFLKQPGRSASFVIGNHDIALAFPAVQALLQERLGPLCFSEDPVLLPGLRVTHGNEWDEANRFDDAGLIGEDARGHYVRFPWGSFFVLDYVRKVRRFVPQIDHIKPLGAFMRWALKYQLRDALIGFVWFVAFVLKYRFHHEPERRFTFGRLWQIFRGSCYSCDFISEAAATLAAGPEKVLIAGHTHRATTMQMSAETAYANTGTWTPIVSLNEGKFDSCLHRTFALCTKEAGSTDFNAAGLQLLEWVPGQGARPYVEQAHNLHLDHQH